MEEFGFIEEETLKEDIRLQLREELKLPSWMEIPEKKGPLPFTWTDHQRGKSVHGDLRLSMDGYLIGVTAFDPAGLGEPRKLNNEPGMKGQKIEIKWKARQPKVWLYFAGKKIGDRKTVEPGKVGATRFLPGIFTLYDKGTWEIGAAKPTFFEFFLKGQKLTGRWTIRQTRLPVLDPETKKPIPGKYRLTWVLWKPKDQEPYAVSERARRKGWYPPKGHIPLPQDWIRKNPAKYKEWLKWVQQKWKGIKPVKPKKFRPKEIPKEEASAELQKLSGTLQFRVFESRWRGPIVIRGIPVAYYYFVIKTNGKYRSWKTELNPLYNETLSLMEETFEKRYWDYEGPLKPQTKYNPTKTLIAKWSLLDKGVLVAEDIREVADEPEKYALKIKGKKLQGVFEFSQDEVDSPIFMLTKLEELEAKWNDFSLQRHWWGEHVHWDISMKEPEKEEFLKWALAGSPLQLKVPIKILKKEYCFEPRWFLFEGSIPPIGAPEWLRPGNPTKNLTAYVKVEDKGTYRYIEDTPNFKIVEFRGNKLKGTFVFRKNETWIFEPYIGPTLQRVKEGYPPDNPYTEPKLEEEDEESFVLAYWDMRGFSSILPDEHLKRYEFPEEINEAKGIKLGLGKYPLAGTPGHVKIRHIRFNKKFWTIEEAKSWMKRIKVDQWDSPYIRA